MNLTDIGNKFQELLSRVNPIPQIQQGITNWATKNPDLARQASQPYQQQVINNFKTQGQSIANLGSQVAQIPQNFYQGFTAPPTQEYTKPESMSYSAGRFFGSGAVGLGPIPQLAGGALSMIPKVGSALADMGRLNPLYTQYGKAMDEIATNTIKNDPKMTPSLERMIRAGTGMVGGYMLGGLGQTPQTNFENIAQKYRNKLTKQDVDIIGRFAEIVETKGPKADLGGVGPDVHNLAVGLFGKDASSWGNQKLKNAFDLVLGKIGQRPNTAGLGLSTQNIREGQKKAAQGSLYDVSPVKGHTGSLDRIKAVWEKTASPELKGQKWEAHGNSAWTKGEYVNDGLFTSRRITPQGAFQYDDVNGLKQVNGPEAWQELMKTAQDTVKGNDNTYMTLEQAKSFLKMNQPNVAQLPISDINNRGVLNKGEQLGQKIPEQVVPATIEPQNQTQLQGKPILEGGSPPSSSSPPSISQDPVQVIMNALKEAKPLEQKQGGIYAKIRSQQAGTIAGIGKNVPGEQGYFAQLGQLKGEMPKVQFESVRQQVTQPHIDSLFNQVEQSNLTPFEKITAKSGLAKLLGAEGGQVPVQGELKLLNEIFPPEFIQTVLAKRPLMEKLWGAGENLLNLPRALMATADLSAPLRQGLFLVGRPKQFLPAFKDMFKYFGSEKAYEGLNQEIKARPNAQLYREAKLALTDMSPILQSREEAFMSNLAEKIPGFGKLAKASNRAYSGFLNKLRADTFDDLVKTATKQGLDTKTVVPDIAKFVNSATGRGDLGALTRSAPVLSNIFFSPRLMASRMNLLNPVYYAKLDPFVRKEALKSLFTFAGTAMTVLGLAKLGGASVGSDPRSADFGKIKEGDTRFDILGGFQQYMVLAARLLSGQMVSSTTGKEFNLGEGYKPTTRLDIIQRFFESKNSPIVSFALGLLKGQTNMGEEFKPSVEIIDRLIPMIASDMYDLYREDGSDGIFKAIPGIFGVGVQTYTDQIPMQGKTATGKPNVQWRQAPGLGENILNTITGNQVSNIPKDQWQGLRDIKQMKTMQQIEKDKVKKQVLETGQSQMFEGKKIELKNGIVTEDQSGGKQPNLLERIMGVKPAGAAETSTPSIKPYLDKMQSKYAEDNVKQQVQMYGQPQEYNGNYYYVPPDSKTGNPVSVPTQLTLPTQPTLTGNTALDKQLVSKFNGSITTEANNVMERLKVGLIDQTEAGKQLEALQALKVKATKKTNIKIKKLPAPKKIKAIKISTKAVSKLKIKNPPKIKMVKTPKLTLPKIKSNIKIK